MIRVEDVKKNFGDTEVLKGITTVFEPGKCNLIIGLSGAGKSVLLKLLVGLIKPTSGKIMYDDQRFSEMDDAEVKALRQQVGMLFQGSALFDSMTVEQNILFPLEMFKRNSVAENLDRVNNVLERVNLKGSNPKFPSELSGGMQKRVGIARAIVLEPKYLFCDEPNSGLDPKTSIVIDELIQGITYENNITTVINTHDMNSVMEIGDNINLLDMGKLVWRGNKSEVLTTDNEFLENFIFASPFQQRLRDAAMSGGLKGMNKLVESPGTGATQ